MLDASRSMTATREISTGATINSDQVYGVATTLMEKPRAYPGFETLSSDYFTRPPLQAINRERCYEFTLS
jgi:hypothetical protein